MQTDECKIGVRKKVCQSTKSTNVVFERPQAFTYLVERAGDDGLCASQLEIHNTTKEMRTQLWNVQHKCCTYLLCFEITQVR